MCRKEGIPVLVDGAHALGQVPVDLGELKPDFFFSNAHKWTFVPRGCAVMYIHPRWRDVICPAVISFSWTRRHITSKEIFISRNR